MKVLLSSNDWTHTVENVELNSFVNDYSLNGMKERLYPPGNEEAKTIHVIGHHTINPFDDFRTQQEYTIQKVCKLLHSNSSSLNIHWTELHDKLAHTYIESLLMNRLEKEMTPTLHELYLLVKEQRKKQFKPKELLALLDVSATLELMENESLPLKQMFNGQTDVPCHEGIEVVYVAAKGILHEYLAPYLALYMEHLTSRYKIANETSLLSSHKSDFTRAEFESFFQDPCYSLLAAWNQNLTDNPTERRKLS